MPVPYKPAPFVPKDVAMQRLLKQRVAGQQLRQAIRRLSSQSPQTGEPTQVATQVNRLLERVSRWADLTSETVHGLFDSDEVPGLEVEMVASSIKQLGETSLSPLEKLDEAADQVRRISEALQHRVEPDLEAAYGWLDESDDSRTVTEYPGRVFVVHGRDVVLRMAVVRLIERLGLEAVVLHEQANRGQAILEKFETETAGATFAVVLLTPDDEGRRRADGVEGGDYSPRARQNVVFEMGYMMAQLGRERVAALVTSEDLERPSDLHGLVYISVDEVDGGAWQLRLALEMQVAGLAIDLNRLSP